jgi:flagellar biosynthetic protein FlhB
VAFDAGERTEAASPRRRQEARAKGQVARSAELNSALLLLGTFGALALGGGAMGQALLRAIRGGIALSGRNPLELEGLRNLYVWTVLAIGQTIAPVALTGMAMGVLGNVLQVGLHVTPEALHPNWGRLNPAAGLRNLLSSRGAVELIKAILKLALLGSVAYWTLRPAWARFAELGQADLMQILAWQTGLALRLGLRVAGVYGFLALADYGYQRWQHEQRLRMTRAEVQEESRQQEGSPQIRARVRSVQQMRATRRMMQDVPGASVVVVNPIHIAVAIKYQARTMRAPRVVAKGKRLMAQRIVAAARAAGVPVVQDIPLARALDKAVGVGGEIPTALYLAVAQILAYVYARDPQAARVGAGR